MGHLLTRRWIAAAIAAVMMATLWGLFMGGPVVAQDEPATAGSTAVQTMAKAPATTKVVASSDVPEGSPLGVQLATIVVLLALSVGYFRLMSHSGRRAPAAKSDEEPAADPAAGDGKRPDRV